MYGSTAALAVLLPVQAITRANLYMDAGADASFVVAPRSDEELVQIGKQTKVSLS